MRQEAIKSRGQRLSESETGERKTEFALWPYMNNNAHCVSPPVKEAEKKRKGKKES